MGLRPNFPYSEVVKREAQCPRSGEGTWTRLNVSLGVGLPLGLLGGWKHPDGSHMCSMALFKKREQFRHAVYIYVHSSEVREVTALGGK